MRKLLPLFLVFVLVFAACGGDDDDDDVASIDDAETCEEVGDAFINEIQTVLDALSELSMDDIASGEEPESMAEFEQNIEEIGVKADEIGCSDEEMAGILEDRVDDLEADGPVAELILEGLRDEIESGDVLE